MWKVATWNVNSINARLDRVVAFLDRHHPDAVLLQELKCTEDRFPHEVLTQKGYHCAVYGQKTYNGVAILSKTPLTEITRGFTHGLDDQARFIAATIHGVRVASAYIPNGQALESPKYGYKLDWLAQLRTHLDQNPGTWLIGGDFNVAPEDRDVFDPKACQDQILFSAPEKEAFHNVCAAGLKDTFRKHCPEGGQFSWWDYRQLAFPKNKGMRIDFILASDPLFAQCTGAYIDRNERQGPSPSDHAPVFAEFKV